MVEPFIIIITNIVGCEYFTNHTRFMLNIHKKHKNILEILVVRHVNSRDKTVIPLTRRLNTLNGFQCVHDLNLGLSTVDARTNLFGSTPWGSSIPRLVGTLHSQSLSSSVSSTNFIKYFLLMTPGYLSPVPIQSTLPTRCCPRAEQTPTLTTRPSPSHHTVSRTLHPLLCPKYGDFRSTQTDLK